MRERFEELYTTTGESGGELEKSFGKKWGWYQSIYAAAGGDILKFERITKLPITQLMMWLMFEKEKTEIELKNIKRNGLRHN